MTTSELCDHGKPFDDECPDCQIEYWKMIESLQKLFGDGDRKKGAREIAKLARERWPETMDKVEGSDR
jgi:hypothetical protein